MLNFLVRFDFLYWIISSVINLLKIPIHGNKYAFTD